MDIWWKINLTTTIIWFFMSFFTSRMSGINNPADFIVGWGGLFLLASWPLYWLALIWQ